MKKICNKSTIGTLYLHNTIHVTLSTQSVYRGKLFRTKKHIRGHVCRKEKINNE